MRRERRVRTPYTRRAGTSAARQSQAAIRLASMRDDQYDDDPPIVVDLVDDAPVADADAPEVFLSSELDAARRACVLGKPVDARLNVPLTVLGQLAQGALNRRRDDDAVWPVHSSPNSRFTCSQGMSFSRPARMALRTRVASAM